jgi:hypothetical protein
LAWRRTTLAATVVILLAAGGVIVHTTATALAALALMAGVWLAVLAVAHRRITALGRGRASTVGRAPAVIALLVAAFAVLSLLVVV